MAPILNKVYNLQEANIRAIFTKLQNFLANGVFNAGALQIKTSSSAVVKTVNTVRGVVNGVHFKKAATDMAALVGTIPTLKFGLFEFRCAVDGTLTTAALTLTAASYAAALESLPTTRATTYAVLGYAVIQNGTGSDFVGGTTALDTSSVTVDYIDTIIPSGNEFLTLP